MKMRFQLWIIVSILIYSCNTIKVKNDTQNSSNNKNARPNIIFIMTDDHAKRAMSAYGSELIKTPNLDRIADEGIRFDRSFVTNSICAPSRAVALTGKYSHINGLRDNRDRFDGTQQTFPKLLQQAGYYTAMVGKWHLKTDPTGFDYWKILPGQGAYYNPKFKEMGGEMVQHTGYVTDLITDIAIEQIKHRDSSKPFALLYFHKAPHRNWMPNPKDLKHYQEKEYPLPKTFFDDYSTRSKAAYEQDMKVVDLYNSFDMKIHLDSTDPEASGGNKKFDAVANWNQVYNTLTPGQKEVWDRVYDPINEDYRNLKLSSKDLAIWKYQRYMNDYLLTVKSMDDNVGRLLDFLEEEKLSENTIVIYTSDQGFYLGEHGWYDKRFMYEESFGTPLAIRYPKRIKGGINSNDLVLNLDLAPTILDYAGIEIPDDMQGASLRTLSEIGNTDINKSIPWRKAVYYHYYEYPHGWHSVHAHRGVRTDRYKLIHFYDIDQWELYDLRKDPDEINNLYDHEDYKEVSVKLKGELKRLRDQYKDTDSI